MHLFLEVILLESLINFILGGSVDFTPETLIRYMVFVLVLSCISTIAQAVIGVGK